MAKTIKEMADDYGRRNPGYAVDRFGNWSACNSEKPSFDFERGANAVLEEVEKVYQKEGAFGVIQLIKQLKEEL